MSIDRTTDQEIEARLLKAAQSISIGSSKAGWATLSEKLGNANTQNSKERFFSKRRTIIWIILIGLFSIATWITIRYAIKFTSETQLKMDESKSVFDPIIPKEKVNRTKSTNKKNPRSETNQLNITTKSNPVFVDSVKDNSAPTIVIPADSTKNPKPFIFW